MSLNSHLQTVTTVVAVNSAVSFESRKVNGQKQVTGFNLLGFGASVPTDGALPSLSPTVTYVTYNWTDKKGATHTTDQLPAYYDENGNLALYTGSGSPDAHARD